MLSECYVIPRAHQIPLRGEVYYGDRNDVEPVDVILE